ncbi:MAG: SDR family NAD(P)-dependent oxidoreductase [Luteimonas sp.]
MTPDSVRALITGGVSGLGLAVARHLVAGGGKVVLFDVNDDKGAEAVAALGDANARYLRTDVTDEAGVVANVAAAREFLGGLNVAVNCAGILGAGRVLGREAPMPLETFSRTVMVNLVGSFNVAKAAAAAMQGNDPGEDGERGVIVNTASIAAYDGQIGQIAYSASKGGIVGMTLPAARDLAGVGVRVCTIAPGLVDTPLLGTLPEEARQSLSAGIPFPRRLARPSDFAEQALDIVEHGYLNGEVIRMDGALRMAPR